MARSLLVGVDVTLLRKGNVILIVLLLGWLFPVTGDEERGPLAMTALEDVGGAVSEIVLDELIQHSVDLRRFAKYENQRGAAFSETVALQVSNFWYNAALWCYSSIHNASVQGADDVASFTSPCARLHSIRYTVLAAMNLLEDHFSGNERKSGSHPLFLLAVHRVRHYVSMFSRDDRRAARFAFQSGNQPYVDSYLTVVQLRIQRGDRVQDMTIQFHTTSPFMASRYAHTPSPTGAASYSNVKGATWRSPLSLKTAELERRLDAEARSFLFGSSSKSGATYIHSAVSIRPMGLIPSAHLRSAGTLNSAPSFDLNLLNFNIWNYNGDWVARSKKIAGIIRSISADIVALQEVRIDSKHELPFSLSERDRYTFYTPSQAEHLTRLVRRKVPYYFDYAPAMLYFHLPEPGGRRTVETELEGPMIMHKSGHVISSIIFPLHRQWKESVGQWEQGDDHQRILLCEVMLFRAPSSAVEEQYVIWLDSVAFVRVDLCTTHFALPKEAQLRNSKETVAAVFSLSKKKYFPAGLSSWKVSEMNDTVSSRSCKKTLVGTFTEGHCVPSPLLSVVCGDLNAPPESNAVQHLLESGFVDAWSLFLQKDSKPQFSSYESQMGFTFNSQTRLLKRIDFVMLHLHGASCRLAVDSFDLLGGPIGRGSASDHLAQNVKIRISCQPTTN